MSILQLHKNLEEKKIVLAAAPCRITHKGFGAVNSSGGGCQLYNTIITI